MKQYYVAFDDSSHDPTYASLEDAYFVVTHSDNSGMGNPCVENCDWVSVAPNNHDELRRYAEVMGWEVQDQNGKLVLITNITK
jgi:hypothetical protein